MSYESGEHVKWPLASPSIRVNGLCVENSESGFHGKLPGDSADHWETNGTPHLHPDNLDSHLSKNNNNLVEHKCFEGHHYISFKGHGYLETVDEDRLLTEKSNNDFSSSRKFSDFDASDGAVSNRNIARLSNTSSVETAGSTGSSPCNNSATDCDLSVTSANWEKHFKSTPNKYGDFHHLSPRLVRFNSDEMQNFIGNSGPPAESPSITLPPRFNIFKDKATDTEKNAVSDYSGNPDDFVSRGRDLDTAIKWLRHEIWQMRRQDYHLKRQFLDLISTIHHLRETSHGMYCSSGSDLSSLNGSTASLDENRLSSSLSSASAYLRSQEADYLTEFRARTVSFNIPRTRFSVRPKSKEYV
ncbi:uncharacterized protein LOC106176461 [Lingula anatina]|uniref:Uncharacterized protein LOC106176461 n=1 Tax=Lingula anatina TaxID=7574 RepID=A0A1S3JW92_LINAN|nr:uncharacterized protein LOC106176461 [Lingula anatina]|eukprot:XP_013414309.1 uncharacterized protein LOC106176461 [Lingula anatina]